MTVKQGFSAMSDEKLQQLVDSFSEKIESLKAEVSKNSGIAEKIDLLQSQIQKIEAILNRKRGRPRNPENKSKSAPAFPKKASPPKPSKPQGDFWNDEDNGTNRPENRAGTEPETGWLP